jgi:hypothetical protein
MQGREEIALVRGGRGATGNITEGNEMKETSPTCNEGEDSTLVRALRDQKKIADYK